MVNYKSRMKGAAIGIFLAVMIALSCIFCIADLNAGVIADAADLLANDNLYTKINSPLEYDTAKINEFVYEYDLSLGDAGAGNSANGDGKYVAGNFYSDKAIIINNRDTTNGWQVSRLPESGWRADFPISDGSNLAKAIADNFVNVRVQLCFSYGKASIAGNGNDNFNSQLGFYYDNDGGKSLFSSGVKTMSVSSSGQELDNGANFNLPTVSAGGLVLSVYLSEFAAAGDGVATNFHTAFKRIYLKITCSVANNLFVTPVSTVIGKSGMRHESAESNQVREGDIIIVFSTVSGGGSDNIPVNSGASDMTNLAGSFYRTLFLNNASARLIEYNYDTSCFTRLYDYSDENYDFSGLRTEYSGATAVFRVNSVVRTESAITARFNRPDGSTTGANSNDFRIDNTAAYTPELDSSAGTFADKYVGYNKEAYYTDPASYEYETLDFADRGAERIITSVNLMNGALKPVFSANSLLVRGASNQAIYYKVTRLPSAPSASSGGSVGFPLSEATGVCHTSYADGRQFSGDLRISLVTDNDNGNSLVYDFDGITVGKPSGDADGKRYRDLTIHENGYYCIEFITVDYVGNRTICPVNYYVKVDVADYKFEYQLLVGNTSDRLSSSDVTIRFATLRENNEMSGFTTESVFKRGDRVVVRVELTNEGYRKYILTNFRCNTAKFAISDNLRNVNIIQSSSIPYTFAVSSAYSEKPDSRWFTLNFKRRANITVSNTIQQYNGAPRNVNTYLTYDGNVISGSVMNYFSTSPDGEYTTTLPVEAGTYYYRCELLNHSTYYATQSGTFVIRPADPDVGDINVFTVNYGNGLDSIDFDEAAAVQDFNAAISALTPDGQYRYDRSSDGIYGYYRIIGIDKSSNAYLKPQATDNLTLTIEFVPIKWTENDDGTVTFEKINGRFVRNNNYNTVNRTISNVVVSRSGSVEITVDNAVGGKLEFAYDGEPKKAEFSLRSTLGAEENDDITDSGRIIYVKDGTTEILYDAPSDAGTYSVTIDIPTGNYIGEWHYELVINPRALYVESEQKVCEFQDESQPAPIALFRQGTETVRYDGLKYKFEYYRSSAKGGFTQEEINEAVKDENRVPESEYFAGSGMPDKAGRYVVKIILDENNFVNAADAYTLLTIRKVSSASGNRISVTVPTLAYNSVDRQANINYMQPLANAVLAGNVNTGVRYYYHVIGVDGRVRTEIREVEGSFRVSYRQYRSDDPDENADDFLADAARYDEFEPGSHSVFLYFIPSGADAENFEPLLCRDDMVITVGKATYVMDDVKISPIFYGTEISGAEDVEISESVKVILTGSGSSAVYSEPLSKDDPIYGYTYSLNLTEGRIFEAGSHYLDVTVTPNSLERFNPITYTCTLTVNKKVVELILSSVGLNEENNYEFEYGSVGVPDMTYSEEGIGALRGNVTYTTESGENAVRPLSVGRYTAKYILDDANYAGEITYGVEVIKAKLTVTSVPSVYEIETAVSYGKLMSAARFYNGVVSDANRANVSGEFRFDYPDGAIFTDTGINKSYNLVFIPSDAENYEILRGITLNLTVRKADLSDGIILSVTEGLTYGDVLGGFDINSVISYDTPVYYKVSDGVIIYDTEKKDGYERLKAEINILNMPSSAVIGAGNYPVVLTIDDVNYGGSATGELTIGKKRAVIEATVTESVFNNRNQSVGYALKDIDGAVISGAVTQTFYLGENRLSGAPSEIGRYRVELNLVSNNYAADTVETYFTIKVNPSQISITNLEQVYGAPRTITVSMGLNNAVFTVTYRDGAGNEYDIMPLNAGEYQVILNFAADDNNGYEEAVSFDTPLKINKFTAGIIVGSQITADYTGRPNRNIRAVTNPYGLNVIVEFCAEDGEEFTAEEVLTANSDGKYHRIRFTIDDANYQGVQIVEYRINRGALTVINAPVFDSVVYNSGVQPEILVDGRVDFGAYVSDMKGIFTLNAEETSRLFVGTHRISFTFTATDEDGNIDGNYLPVNGLTEITVIKQNISEDYINIGEAIGDHVSYNGDYFDVDANLSGIEIYDREGDNSDFRIVVYYNGTLSRPREPGTYTVRAIISSRNYSGERTWEIPFTVDRGEPSISVLPRAVGSYRVGDTLRANDITGGQAVIEGKTTVINGSFTAAETTFNKANYNEVEITFSPADHTRFKDVVFTISVFAEGENPLSGVKSGEVWDEKTVSVKNFDTGDNLGSVVIRAYAAGEVFYGAPLSAFTLRFEALSPSDEAAAAYLNANGILNFRDRNAVLSVGEKAEVVFTPTGEVADRFSIMNGYISVDIRKAEMTDISYKLICVGDNVGDIELIIYNKDGSIRDTEGELSLYLDAERTQKLTSGTPVDKEWKRLYFTYVTDNFTDIASDATLEVLTNVSADDIIVENLKKSFDGKNISVDDLKISVVNVQPAPKDGDIYIRIFLDGVEVTDADVAYTGVYSIIIYFDNELYYGTKTVEFTVERNDVSDIMGLSAYSASYGNFANHPYVTVGGERIDGSLYTLEYKREGELDSAYNPNLPINAGTYDVRVVISGSNGNYGGSRTFKFTVEKLKVRLVAETSYSYNYGDTAAPSVGFAYADSDDAITLDYIAYYYSDGYSLSTDRPENAGRYRVRIVLTDNNYILNDGYAEFNMIINQMSVTVTTLPVAATVSDGSAVYNIKYGQPLREVSLTGGEATRNDAPVRGRFIITEPTAVLDAGTHIISVTFIPSDGNYTTVTAEIQITVAQADATVYFDNLQTEYNGLSGRGRLRYTVSPAGVGVRIEFVNRLNEVVADPVATGNYSLRVTSTDANYRIADFGGGTEPVFVIAKASVSRVTAPYANPISVGDNLSKSTLTSGADFGQVYYDGFARAVEGTFEFIDYSKVFMNAGSYSVGYRFVPYDNENFATYEGETEITVTKATASITVSDNVFTYSEGFKYPTFTTNPSNLNVVHNISFNEYNPDSPDYIFREEDIVNVGTYYFEVWVEDENYSSERMEFAIIINKKQLDVDFVDASGNLSVQYVTTYGKNINPKLKLYPSGTAGKRGYLLKDEFTESGVHISELFTPRYRSVTSGINYDDRNAPQNIGTYTLMVELWNDNYTATGTIIYRIDVGTIDEVIFDTALLEGQVYGNVKEPQITTSPAGVSYYIVYQGYSRMPTDAGSYNLIVHFNDDNYEKKQASAMFRINKKKIDVTNIIVEDKVYDGVPTLKISGQLTNIELDDEVILTMTAETAGRAVNVGYHEVNIVSYMLSGLDAANYELNVPRYYDTVRISASKIDSSGNSFITSSDGFAEGTTVEFNLVNSPSDSANFFENLTGRTTRIIGYKVKENGLDPLFANNYKIYVEIPEEFLNTDFEVTGIGDLASQNLIFNREGNYITFTSTSANGQIVFQKKEFKYGMVVFIVAIVLVVIGIVIVLILVPLQHRRKFASDAEARAIRRIKKGE